MFEHSIRHVWQSANCTSGIITWFQKEFLFDKLFYATGKVSTKTDIPASGLQPDPKTNKNNFIFAIYFTVFLESCRWVGARRRVLFLCANFLGINSSIDSYHYLKILSLRLAIQNLTGQLCCSFSLTPLKNFGITNASFKHLIHVFKSALILWASHFDIVWNL